MTRFGYLMLYDTFGGKYVRDNGDIRDINTSLSYGIDTVTRTPPCIGDAAPVSIIYFQSHITGFVEWKAGRLATFITNSRKWCRRFGH